MLNGRPLLPLFLLAVVGCGSAPSPNRSPSADDDPDRAARSLEEEERINQEIEKAQQENARRTAGHRP